MLEQLQSIIDVINPVASWIIAVAAVIGIFNTRWIWKQTNRPVISALVETESTGDIMSTFNLIVVNSGNRPATNIQLTIDDYEEFKKCLTIKVDHPLLNSINRCFSEDGMIPLLIDGKKKTNSFGLISRHEEDNIWKYKSNFSISISYEDLERKKYQSNVTLFIKHTTTIAGGSWVKSEEKITHLLEQILRAVDPNSQ